MTQAKPNPLKKNFAPGQYLFREGDPSQCMYLIQKGTIAVRKSKGGAWVEIGRLYSNEVLGELSFFDRQPRSAAAIALTEVEVLEIHFDALDKVYALVPEYLRAIMASVADRLRKANDTIRRLQKNVVSDGSAGGAASSEAAENALDEIPNDIPATSTVKPGSED